MSDYELEQLASEFFENLDPYASTIEQIDALTELLRKLRDTLALRPAPRD